MGKLRVHNIEAQTGTNVDLGAAGDVVTFASDSIQTNLYKDSGGNTIFQSNGSGTLSNVNTGLQGAGPKLITSTYDLYCFRWIECQSVSDETSFSFNGSNDSGATYNVDKVSTFYYTWYAASGGTGSLTQWDTGQLDNGNAGTVYQRLNMGADDTGGNAWASANGELWLFEPANTSKITNWISVGTSIDSSPGVYGVYTSGYFDIAGAINAINFQQWSPSTGFNGTIKLYGIS